MIGASNIYMFALPLSLLLNSVAAYEKPTHAPISGAALFQSVLWIHGGLLDIGLQRDVRKQREFPNPGSNPRTLYNTLLNGSEIEDNQLRPVNHFFTPSSGLGLLNLFTPTPNWALEDRGDIEQMISEGWSIDAQEYSLKDARTSFYDALTNPDLTQRRAQWGRTFQTLGQAMHLLHGTVQSLHVRNDGHLSEVFG